MNTVSGVKTTKVRSPLSEAKQFYDYNVSRHAMERYVERIMGKDDLGDINRFIITNEDKIKVDINKLICYGELIYTGRQSQKDGKGNVVDVYLKDCWVVLLDNKARNVITLFKVDLGLDDDFNRAYVSKMLDKLNTSKANLLEIQQAVQAEADTYRELIAEAEIQIKEFRSMIKNLEELCTGYRLIIDNNCVKITQATQEVTEVLNTLIGKRTF